MNLQSESITQIATALSTAQADMQNAVINKENPHFRSRYADLSAMRDATIPHLSKNGLSLSQQPIVKENGDFILRTLLMHNSGEWIGGEFPLPRAAKLQELGSAITYAKRYSWSAICGVASEEDDDGNEGQHANLGQPKRAPPPPPRKREDGQAITPPKKEAETTPGEDDFINDDSIMTPSEKAHIEKLHEDGKAAADKGLGSLKEWYSFLPKTDKAVVQEMFMDELKERAEAYVVEGE